MLITIHIADVKLANHYNDIDALYVSDFKLKTIKTKKGLASDDLVFTLHKDIFDSIDRSFIYSCYGSPVKLFLDDILLFNGYIDKLSTERTNRIKFNIKSNIYWFFKTNASPKKTVYCQNQLGAVNCGINVLFYKASFENVPIDGFTGYVSLRIKKDEKEVILGGSSSFMTPIIDGNEVLKDGNLELVQPLLNTPLLLELENWTNAYVVINGVYKTNIVNIINNAIYLGLNFTDTKLVAETLDIYLKCDKTYGQCYKKFNNVQNFWGFPNNREDIAKVDIFSATNLVYCGQEEQEFEECPFDHNLYGVEL